MTRKISNEIIDYRDRLVDKESTSNSTSINQTASDPTSTQEKVNDANVGIPTKTEESNISNITPDVVAPTVAPKVEPHTKVNSMEEMFLQLNKKPTPTPEQLEREERRAKSRRTIAMIGDGLSSIANIIGASKGAKALNTQSMTHNVSERNRRFMERRRASEEQYKDALQRARLQDMSLKAQREAREQTQANADRVFEFNKRSAENNEEERLYNAKRQEEADRAKAIADGVKQARDINLYNETLKGKTLDNADKEYRNTQHGKRSDKDKDMTTIALKGADKNVFNHKFNKVHIGALVGMTEELYALRNIDATEEGDYATLFGPGVPDRTSAMLSYIQKHASKYPQLTEKIKALTSGDKYVEDKPKVWHPPFKLPDTNIARFDDSPKDVKSDTNEDSEEGYSPFISNYMEENNNKAYVNE